MSDDPTNVTPLRAADKPPRPPHVIVLSSAMRQLSQLEAVGGLVVAWYGTENGDDQSLNFESLGSDDAVVSLCERVKLMTLFGGRGEELPSDE